MGRLRPQLATGNSTSGSRKGLTWPSSTPPTSAAATGTVNWDGYGLGLTDIVTPQIKFDLEPIKTGTTGKMVLGHRFLGLMGEIKIDVLEIGPELFAKVFPWAVPGPNGLSLTPPLNVDLYDYARLLVLHPTDRPGDKTEDLWLPRPRRRRRWTSPRAARKTTCGRSGFRSTPTATICSPSRPVVATAGSARRRGSTGGPPGVSRVCLGQKTRASRPCYEEEASQRSNGHGRFDRRPAAVGPDADRRRRRSPPGRRRSATWR